MKSRIFFYLFIFAFLIALYQFVSVSGVLKDATSKMERLKVESLKLNDSIKTLNLKLHEMEYFSLDSNDDAFVYYEHLNLKNTSGYIADKLLETNEGKGDNPLVPYEGMDGDFKINKIKILNHKWIVADFSDGQYWGDLLIKYELKDDLGVDFSLIDHLLYARSN